MGKKNVGTKAAADGAAKVAIAVLDTASHKKVSSDVQENAEEAAVAAGKGVSDHPADLTGALSEAVSTVKTEEKAGAVDTSKSPEGIIAKAEDKVAKVEDEVSK